MTNKNLTAKLCKVAFAVSSILASPSVIFAAEGNSADDSNKNEVNKIIVTASKREVYLQDVPMSIQSITGEGLEDMGADEFDNYSKTISSLSVVDRGPSNKKYTIRGISTGVVEATAAAVGVYIDEMPVSLAEHQPDIKLFDVERIEVLKGPQGTLYGEGSLGGTIKTITNKPNLSSLEGKIGVNMSHTSDGGDNIKLNGMVNIPLIDDQLALRLVAYDRDISGFIDRVAQPEGQIVDLNPVFELPPGTVPEFVFGTPPITAASNINDEQTTGGRASLLWKPSEALSITLSTLTQKMDAGGAPIEVAGVGENKTNQYTDETIRDDLTLSNLTVDYDLGWATLLASSSLYNREFDAIYDFSGPGGLFTGFQITGGLYSPYLNDSRIFSEEIRLTSYGDSDFQYIVGLFYVDKTIDEVQTLGDSTGVFTNVYNTYIGVGAFGPTPFISDASEALDTLTTTDETQKAFFAEMSYNLSQDLVATFGLRHFDIEQKVAYNNIGLDTYGQAILESRPTTVTSTAETGDIFKINIAYSASDDLLYYASATEGFRAGGNNTAPGLTDAQRQYGSDSLINYEIGARSTMLDGSLALNASLYHIDWKDIQLSLPIGFSSAVQNAGEATIDGIELDLVAALSEGLELTMSVGSLNAELAENTAEGDAYLAGDFVFNPGFKGDSLPGVPEVNASAALQYTFPVETMNMDGFARLDLSYTGGSATTLNDLSFGTAEPNHFKIDSYSLANVRFGVRSDDWTVTLYADNLTDKRVELLRDNITITETITRNRPRTVGVDLQMRF